jgi:hypothetical protein
MSEGIEAASATERAAIAKEIVASATAARASATASASDLTLLSLIALAAQSERALGRLANGRAPARGEARRVGDRWLVRTAPVTSWSGLALGGATSWGLFEAGFSDVKSIDARQLERAANVAELTGDVLTAVGHTLAYGGRARVLAGADRSLIELALAPLISRGALAVEDGAPEPSPHLIAVAPYLFGKDELRYVASNIASQAIGNAGPTSLVVAIGWPQAGALMNQIEAKLASLSAVDRRPTLIAHGSDEAPVFLDALVALGEPVARARSITFVLHSIHEEHRDVAAALDRALLDVPARAIGVNHWPGFVLDAYPLRGLDKRVSFGPVRSAHRPAWFLDHARRTESAARLARYFATPSLGAALSTANVARRA